MTTLSKFLLPSLLLASLALGGCGLELGTAVPQDPTLTAGPLEELPLLDTSNPHVGLTAGRPAVVPVPPSPSPEGTGGVDLQSLLDQLGPEADSIRDILEDIVGPSQPPADAPSDDGSLTWSELKRRYSS